MKNKKCKYPIIECCVICEYLHYNKHNDMECYSKRSEYYRSFKEPGDHCDKFSIDEEYIYE